MRARTLSQSNRRRALRTTTTHLGGECDRGMNAFHGRRKRILVVCQALVRPTFDMQCMPSISTNATTHSTVGLRTTYGLVDANLSRDDGESRQVLQHSIHTQSLDRHAERVWASVHHPSYQGSDNALSADKLGNISPACSWPEPVSQYHLHTSSKLGSATSRSCKRVFHLAQSKFT
jgi:hypothetical protein